MDDRYIDADAGADLADDQVYPNMTAERAVPIQGSDAQASPEQFEPPTVIEDSSKSPAKESGSSPGKSSKRKGGRASKKSKKKSEVIEESPAMMDDDADKEEESPEDPSAMPSLDVIASALGKRGAAIRATAKMSITKKPDDKSKRSRKSKTTKVVDEPIEEAEPPSAEK